MARHRDPTEACCQGQSNLAALFQYIRAIYIFFSQYIRAICKIVRKENYTLVLIIKRVVYDQQYFSFHNYEPQQKKYKIEKKKMALSASNKNTQQPAKIKTSWRAEKIRVLTYLDGPLFVPAIVVLYIHTLKVILGRHGQVRHGVAHPGKAGQAMLSNAVKLGSHDYRSLRRAANMR